ncbi:MAG: hypothetical protein AB7O26_06040 [Planctomycetaceae bacterium]
MYEFFSKLDRRWIFLITLVVMSISVLAQLKFPELPSKRVRDVFDSVENLPDGSLVVISFDYDPASAGELDPMAAAFVRHCGLKKHKIITLGLWPGGVPLAQQKLDSLLREQNSYEYGRDFVNLGYKAGAEGVIKLVMTNLRQICPSDSRGTPLSEIPLTKDLKNFQQCDLIASVSAGTPGAKEWVQYAATPYNVDMVAGSTGVQAPGLYPYIPSQLNGMLAAIKGAAEYEQTLLDRYPELLENPNAREAQRRMGPQLVMHLWIILLIVVGNIVYFAGKKRQEMVG